MPTASERPADQPTPTSKGGKTTRTYSKCGQPDNVSRGCGRQLVTDEEKRRGICDDFPMCS